MVIGDRLPYPGLRSFTREESDLFFGRDESVDTMVDLLTATRFLSVLGASGSGKSSLVRTGLIDGLELGLHPAGSEWLICDFHPGGRPFFNLANALLTCQTEEEDVPAPSESQVYLLESFLRRGPLSLIEWVKDGNLAPGTNLLILADQFEELFRFGNYSEKEDAEAFVNILMASSEAEDVSIHVVLTMRSEFLNACSLLPNLAEKINEGTFLTPRMSRENCRKAIVGPAKVVGADFEPALATHILNDLASFAPWEDDTSETDHLQNLSRRSDQLPVMQHVLNQLWQTAKDEGRTVLTLDDYLALGGVEGAINSHTEKLISSIDGALDEDIVEKIFRTLVDGNSVASGTRRPLSLKEIADESGKKTEDVKTVLDLFRSDEACFIRPGQETALNNDTIIDISHESLIRQWSKLSEWFDKEARAASFWHRLRTASELYDKKEGDLLHGLDLANINNWWEQESPSGEWATRYGGDYDKTKTFLNKSLAEEKRKQEIQAQRDEQEKIRLRKWLALAATLAIVAVGAALWGAIQYNTAEENLTVAISAADRLALDVSEELKQSTTMSSQEKRDLLETVRDRFDELMADTGQNTDLTIKHAGLLNLSAQTSFSLGYLEEAYDLAVKSKNELARIENLIDADDRQYKLEWAKANLLFAKPAIQFEEFEEAQKALIDIDTYYSGLDSQNTALNFEEEQVLAQATMANADLAYLSGEYVNYFNFATDAISKNHKLIEKYENGGEIAPEKIKTVYEDLLRSRRIQLNTISNLGLFTPVDQEEVINEDIDKVRAFYEANNFDFDLQNNTINLIKIKLYDIVGDAEQSYQLLNESIVSLHNMLKTDPQNLFYRDRLFELIDTRVSQNTTRKNFDKIKDDLDLAKELLFYSLANRKLTINSYRNLLTYYRTQRQYYSAISDGNGALIAIHSYTKLIDLLNETKTSNNLSAVFHMLSEYDKLTLDIALGTEHYQSDRMIAVMDDYEQAFGQNLYLMNLQAFASVRDVDKKQKQNSLTAADIERAIEFHDNAISTAPSVSSASWNRSYLYRILADFLSEREAKPDAIGAYIAAMDDRLVTAKYRPFDHAQKWSTLVNAKKAIDLQIELEDWHGILSVANQLSDNIGILQVQDPEEGTNKHGWPNLVTSMENAVAAIESQNVDVSSCCIDGYRNHILNFNGAFDTSQIASESSTPNATEVNSDADIVIERVSWSSPPLYKANWRTIAGEEFDLYKQHFETAYSFEDGYLNERIQRIRITELPFYQSGIYAEAEYKNTDEELLILSMLIGEDKKYILNGTSAPIHSANRELPIQLNNLLDVQSYLKFYASNYRKDPYLIVEDLIDIPWTLSEDVSYLYPTIEYNIRPTVVTQDSSSRVPMWRAVATIQYAQALYHVDITIQTNGQVAFGAATNIASDLPVVPPVHNDAGRKNERLNDQLSSVDEDAIEDFSDLIGILGEQGRDELAQKFQDFTGYRAELAQMKMYLDQIDHIGRHMASNNREEGQFDELIGSLRRTISSLATSKDYGKAASLYAEFFEFGEEVLTAGSITQTKLASSYGSHAWYAIFNQEFAAAETSSRRALELDPTLLWIETNLAHAFLFQDRFEEATEIYLKNRGKRIPNNNNNLWERVIADDFRQFRENDINHEEMDRILELLDVEITEEQTEAKVETDIYTQQLTHIGNHMGNNNRQEDQYDELIGAVGRASLTLSNDKQFDKATNLYTEFLKFGEEVLTAGNIPKTKLAGEYGSHAWRAIFSREFAVAESSSRRALELDPILLWIETNLAHALLFQGKTEEAIEIYLKNKGQRVAINNNAMWETVVTDDFRQFRENNITHEEMDRILELLAE